MTATRMGRKKKELPPQLLEQLGKLSDAEIARRAGMVVATVRRIRTELGIPGRKERTQSLRKKAEALMPQCTDAEIATNLQISPSRVFSWRTECRIKYQGQKEAAAPPQQITHFEAKYPGLHADLGRTPDAELGRRYGISRERVRQFRSMLGIAQASSAPPLRSQLPDSVKSQLGSRPDKQLAREIGVDAHHIRRLRCELGIPAHSPYAGVQDQLAHLFGKVSDIQIAREYGVPAQTVRSWRQKAGIDPFMVSPVRAGVKVPRDGVRQLFEAGKSDEELAQHYCTSIRYVQNVRRELGLYRGPRTPRRSRKVDPQEVSRLHEEGIPGTEIARRLGCVPNTIYRILREKK